MEMRAHKAMTTKKMGPTAALSFGSSKSTTLNTHLMNMTMFTESIKEVSFPRVRLTGKKCCLIIRLDSPTHSEKLSYSCTEDDAMCVNIPGRERNGRIKAD